MTAWKWPNLQRRLDRVVQVPIISAPLDARSVVFWLVSLLVVLVARAPLARAEAEPSARTLPKVGASAPSRDATVGDERGAANFRAAPYPPGSSPDPPGSMSEGARVYYAIGRADLALRYEHRTTARGMLVLGGLIVTLGGLLAMLFDVPHEECTPRSPMAAGSGSDCRHVSGGVPFVLGIAGSVLGPAVIESGMAIEPDPVTLQEKRRLIDAYNASQCPSLSASPPLGWRAAPRPLPGGGGIMLQATF